jgi:glucose dehydrogenase
LAAALVTVSGFGQIQNQSDNNQRVMPAKNYASTLFSTLDQINTGNAKNLRLAFTFSTGATHGIEAAPLVVDNTMYIVTPYPNVLYALDLTKPGAALK